LIHDAALFVVESTVFAFLELGLSVCVGIVVALDLLNVELGELEDLGEFSILKSVFFKHYSLLSVNNVALTID